LKRGYFSYKSSKLSYLPEVLGFFIDKERSFTERMLIKTVRGEVRLRLRLLLY